jgi:hypothetical protein
MVFTDCMKMECPVGYVPVPRPKEWNISNDGNSYKAQCPQIQLSIPRSEIEATSFIACITMRLYDHLLIRGACYQQLSRVSINDFVIGVEKMDKKPNCLLPSEERYLTPKEKETDTYIIVANQIYIFQRDPKFIPEIEVVG